MGGSGGGYFPGTSKPEELRKQVRAAEEKARSEHFETDLANLLDEFLTNINPQNIEARGRHIDEIKKALGSEIEGSVDLRFGGSVAKHTFVNGLSDVDALVMVSKTELAGKNPSEIQSYFQERLRERFPNTKIEKGRLAITLSFSDIDVQILPALKVGSGVKIHNQDGSKWSPIIRPDQFAKKLTDVNRLLNGKLVPSIKLAKSILSQLPTNQQLSGYHVESLAIEIFKGYEGEKTTRDLVRFFFTHAAPHLKNPIKDSTGQSINVDDYLGSAGSLHRRIAADSISRIGRSIQNADGANSVEQWREILEDTPYV